MSFSLLVSLWIPSFVLGQVKSASPSLSQEAQHMVAPPNNGSAQAKGILQNPLYREMCQRKSSNWLGKAFERIGDFFRFQMRPPRGQVPRGGDFSWLTGLAWALLSLCILVALFFIVRHFTYKGRLKRRAKAMLDDEEAERTLDEWLVIADDLERQGRYREAVRALYLALLLKLDEHGVARFVRYQTNWEHLERISVSPTRPPELDFRPATQAFDRVWYGFQVEGLSDTQRFRQWYSEIVKLLESKVAA